MIQDLATEDFKGKTKKGLVLVVFWGAWCSPCNKLISNLEKLSNEYDNVNFYKINMDENPVLVERYKIFAVPTVIILKNNKQVKKLVGIKKNEEYEEFLSK